ncbi:YibE/F family protein [Patescibacteria group bacterium]|nr:MAG: YibE/F family protein [Patescibacteria group bacterium]
MKSSSILPALALCILFTCPAITFAEEATSTQETVTFSKAKVLEVTNEQTAIIPGTDTPSQSQTLKVEVLDGAEKGNILTFDNDYIQLERGDVFYLRHLTSQRDATDIYTVSDPYRLDVLIGLALIFLLLILVFGGLPGVRGIASLAGSIVLIFWLLLPSILQGFSPILSAIGVSSLIIVVGSYITHGFNKTTSAAVLGMLATVVITGLAAFYVVHVANLSGYTSEESVYLNFNTNGSIDMMGLLFGGIMIGLLGILYDIAIGQAVAVEELFRAGAHMTRRQVYQRAIRIGKEHIGALVNTLAIAYVGAALPLLLLMVSSTDTGVLFILNNELFATEIVRILIGSIGLILAVPITTIIASYLLATLQGKGSSKETCTHIH